MKCFKKLFTFLMVCLVTIVGILPTTASQVAAASNDHIYFIELGITDGVTKGNATLIESNGLFGLIDAGNKNDTKESENGNESGYVYKFVEKKLDGKNLNFLIVSHLDADHAGGVLTIINTFCDKNTILCIKDFEGDSVNHNTRYTNIMNAAKEKGLIIYKIKPTEKVTASTQLSKITNGMMTTYFNCWKRNSDTDKTYVQYGTASNLTLGNYTLTLYNGNNWNSTNEIKNLSGEWDENVNSVTALIQRTGTGLTTFSTYLASDLGENSKAYGNSTYSLTIAKKAVDAMNKKVTVYQVAHHGYYNSLTEDIAAELDFKYAIVTNSFDDIINTGNIKFNNNISKSMDTLTALLGSSKINTVYFTSGGTVNGTQGIRNYFNTESNGKTIVSGTVDVCFNDSSATISQN